MMSSAWRGPGAARNRTAPPITGYPAELEPHLEADRHGARGHVLPLHCLDRRDVTLISFVALLLRHHTIEVRVGVRVVVTRAETIVLLRIPRLRTCRVDILVVLRR